MSKRLQISRRTLLRGAMGAALALPFLEAMSPRESRADPVSGPPKRLLFIHVPVGFKQAASYMASDTPAGGLPYTLPAIMQPLAPLQKKITLVENLHNRIAVMGGTDNHSGGTGAMLTCQPCSQNGSTVKNGISVDQVLAQAQGQSTSIGSLVLGVGLDSDDGGEQPTLSSNISWQDESTPIAKERDPVRLFQRLFGDLSLSPAELDLKRTHQKSVLNSVTANATALRSKLGGSDQKRLDQYLSGISALEAKLLTNSSCIAPVPAAPSLIYTNEGAPGEVGVSGVSAHIDVLSDLLVHGFACDLTRVATFKLSSMGFTNWQFLGFSDQHHALSHIPDDPTVDPNSGLTPGQKLDKIATWEMERLFHLLSALDSIDEQDGTTVLDNTLVFVSSDVGVGALHTHDKMPVILAGGGGKVIKSGQHIVTKEEQPFANLFVSMLQFAGVDATTFGADGTGPLSEIMV